ncbi:MAG: hypothetical protein ABIH23_16875 [bacterium]
MSKATQAAVVEALADYAHDAWSGWMRYQEGRGGTTFWDVLPPELSNRWRRQMETSYADLPENERESDREEARRMLAIIAKHFKPEELAKHLFSRHGLGGTRASTMRMTREEATAAITAWMNEEV